MTEHDRMDGIIVRPGLQDFDPNMGSSNDDLDISLDLGLGTPSSMNPTPNYTSGMLHRE